MPRRLHADGAKQDLLAVRPPSRAAAARKHAQTRRRLDVLTSGVVRARQAWVSRPLQDYAAFIQTTYPTVQMRRPTENNAFVFLGSEADAQLFDRVKAFREAHPDSDMVAAFQEFCTAADLALALGLGARRASTGIRSTAV